MLRIVRKCLHPIAQLRRMHLQVFGRLRVRDPAIPDQPYRLKLELPRKPSSLHDPPPVPSKHLTRCLRNWGQATRHIPRLREYYGLILSGLIAGKDRDQIESDLSSSVSFAFLTKIPAFNLPPNPAQGDRAFKRGTKTAAFFATALPNGARCNLCGALVHKNSIQFDHDIPKRDGGSAALENAKVTHPYCNSIKDHLVGIEK